MEQAAPAWQQLIIRTNRVLDLAEQEGIQTACVPGACADKTGNYSSSFPSWLRRGFPSEILVTAWTVHLTGKNASQRRVVLQQVDSWWRLTLSAAVR